MSPAHRPIYVAEPPAHYLARPPMVVDSSMVCAVLFDEPERGQAQSRLAGRHLVAPQLLDHEVANVAVKKQRKGMPESAVEQALADYLSQDIELMNTDIAAQYALARQYGLSAYDAAYLWLAADLKTPLATFDRQLAEAARAHLSTLK